jgi:hypothetical protein
MEDENLILPDISSGTRINKHLFGDTGSEKFSTK